MSYSPDDDLPPPKTRATTHPITGVEARPCDARVLGEPSNPRYGMRCQRGAYNRILVPMELPDGRTPDPTITALGTTDFVPKFLCSAHCGVWHRNGQRLPHPDFFWSEKRPAI